MNSGGSYSDVPDNPTGKRRRISLACSACRTRKSRCNGLRPKCSGCEELGFECIYINPASSSNVIIGKEYLTELEGRLKTVEQDIKALKTKQNKQPYHPRFDDEPEYVPDGRQNGSPLRAGLLHEEEVEVDSDELQDSFDPENVTDGMGAMIFSAEADCGFFGPSSNIAFTRYISRAMARPNLSLFAAMDVFSPGKPSDVAVISISQPASPSARNSALRRMSKSANRANVNIYALPSETATRNLIAQYFGDTGLLFPYIYEQAFVDTYNEVKANNFTKVGRTWLGLLNIIMAMATTTTVNIDLSAEQRVQDSDVYYQRAAGLCEKQIMRGTSLEIVQYLLLTGQYLQGTQRSVEAWTVHGLAVKGALQLGLHSTAASRRFSPLDQEFRKRAWYGCVVLDRTLSMTFGRPAAIPDDYIRIQIPLNLGPAGNEANNVLSNDPEQDVSVDFFVATITLYKIMWNIINQLYGSNIGCGPQTTTLDTISQLFTLEQQLSMWEKQLPSSLNLSNINDLIHRPDPSPYSLDRFQIILKLRYHNVRILLHRPILVKFLDAMGKLPDQSDAQDANFMLQFGSNSVQISVQASMDIVAIVRTIVTGETIHRSRLGAWWFSLYYTFNAALVIFASLLILKDRSSNGSMPLPLVVSEMDLRQGLIDAALALRKLDRGNRMVERCAVYLERLVSVAEAQTASGFDVPSLSNEYSETSASSLLSMYSDGQLFGTGTMDASPLGMDLGEFLLEGDLEFLNQISSAQHAQMSKMNGGAGLVDNGASLLS